MTGTTLEQSVADSMRQVVSPGLHRYLVIDASAFGGVDLRVALPVQGDGFDLLARTPVDDWRTLASPVLLPLPDSAWTERQLKAWCRFASDWRFASALTFIEAPMDSLAMASALSERTQAELPDSMPVVLRYFDCRVLHVLLQQLRPHQRSAFLGSGTRWIYADRWANAVVAAAEEPGPDVPFEAPLRLDAQQEAALLEAAGADVVIDQLLSQRHARLMSMAPPEQHAVIERLLARARGHGTVQNPDQVAWCVLGLAVGEHFAAEAPWSDAVAGAAEGRWTFADAVARLADGDLA